jgi:hypothetical protein
MYLKYALHLFAIYRSKGYEEECASLERDIMSILLVTNSEELKIKISETMYYNNNNDNGTNTTVNTSQETAMRGDEEYHKGIVIHSDEGFPLFTTEVKFNQSEIQMTDCVEGSLSISSLFNEDLVFDKMKLYIGKEEDVVLTINHSNSKDDTSSSSSSSQAASDSSSLSRSLLFTKGEVKGIDFKFNFDPEKIKRANKKVFTLDKIECIIARPYTSSDKQVNANREIIFSLNPFPLSFLKVLSSFPGSSPVSEAIEAIVKPVPPAIYINGPDSTLQLQSTNKIELLQGVIQRVDISFSTRGENITNGKLYFSYEFTTNSSDSPLFWYPKYTDFPISSSPEFFVNLNLDTINFYPLLLDTNFQMSQPFSLPTVGENSTLSVPIFIRCESISNIKIKARFEYLHSSSRSEVVKEFEFYCTVVRPLSVNFSFISTRCILYHIISPLNIYIYIYIYIHIYTYHRIFSPPSFYFVFFFYYLYYLYYLYSHSLGLKRSSVWGLPRRNSSLPVQGRRGAYDQHYILCQGCFLLLLLLLLVVYCFFFNFIL